MALYGSNSIRNAIKLTAISLSLSACIYRMDIEQGNLLEDSAIEQV